MREGDEGKEERRGGGFLSHYGHTRSWFSVMALTSMSAGARD